MIWGPLVESTELIDDAGELSNVAIAPYWIEEPVTVHNLPVAEFDDTGFIGRADERHRLKTLLESDHRVVTVVGAGGIGKTALALRVCYDIVNESSNLFDQIIWVSLKTHRLTPDGVREIAEAVHTTSMLVDHVATTTGVTPSESTSKTWSEILLQMEEASVLLVIDNLETLGTQIRDLAIGIPQRSKLLLTSRVGLGEIELRFPVQELSARDSTRLMRQLGVVYGYATIRNAEEKMLSEYCSRLYHNPLLMKWFVQAVGRGSNPSDVLEHQDLDQALTFCLANVYRALSESAKQIMATLLAARRSLSQAQIREMTAIGDISFEEALIELRRTNMIVTLSEGEGQGTYQVGGLVLDYLSRNHPPENRVLRRTRELLKKWRVEQDKSAQLRSTYRYAKSYLHVTTEDQRISAPYLSDALRAIRKQELEHAERCVSHAQELTPDWAEVHRVRALLFGVGGRPIYEIESAYELALEYSESDVFRRHYALYLISIHEYERALEHIDLALQQPDCLPLVLKSVRGLVLTRLARVEEALLEHGYVWERREQNQSRFDRVIQGTQYAEAQRRFAEQLVRVGKYDDAVDALLSGVDIVETTAQEFDWDQKLAHVGVHILAETLSDGHLAESSFVDVEGIAARWDRNKQFVRSCDYSKTRRIFDMNDVVARCMPQASGYGTRIKRRIVYVGKLVFLHSHHHYGFIANEDFERVHLDTSSLVRPTSWPTLRLGQRLSFEVVKDPRGLHAVRVAPADL